MPTAFALLTSDPTLLGCDLHRLRSQVQLGPGERRRALGLGSYAGDEVLLQRYAPDDAPATVDALFPLLASEALLAHCARLPPDRPLDGSAQPLRLRRWLFCMVGSLDHFARLQPALLAELPGYLRRHVVHATEQEFAFALFLKALRGLGRTDDRALEPELAARLLGDTARRLQALSAEAGAARASPFALLATNQCLLAACRTGGQPLYYRPLEGADFCERCGLTVASPPALVRAHARRRTVALATELREPAGWLPVPEGVGLAADAGGRIRLEPPPSAGAAAAHPL